MQYTGKAFFAGAVLFLPKALRAESLVCVASAAAEAAGRDTQLRLRLGLRGRPAIAHGIRLLRFAEARDLMQ